MLEKLLGVLHLPKHLQNVFWIVDSLLIGQEMLRCLVVNPFNLRRD